MIVSREEDVISPAEDSMDGQLCFYDVLTDHYVRVPASGKRILDLIVQLWSQSFASHIFALLFHKWVCKHASSVLIFSILFFKLPFWKHNCVYLVICFEKIILSKCLVFFIS